MNFEKELTKEQKYKKIIKWRYARYKRANSPIHPRVPSAIIETLQSIMLMFAPRTIMALTGENKLDKVKFTSLHIGEV